MDTNTHQQQWATQASVDELHGLVKSVGASLQDQIDVLVGRFDRLEQRFDSFEQRFDALEQRFDSLEQRFDSLEQRLDRLEAKFDVFMQVHTDMMKQLIEIRTVQTHHEQRLTRLEAAAA